MPYDLFAPSLAHVADDTYHRFHRPDTANGSDTNAPADTVDE